MKWLIGVLFALAVLGSLFYWAVADGDAPPGPQNEFDLAAYRALVAGDAPAALPTAVNVQVVGASEAPGFAAEAGAFSTGELTFSYVTFQIVTPMGDVLVDGAVDQATLDQMSGGKGRFDQAAYDSVLQAMARANVVMLTHEHLDHVMAIARHPEPAAIAPRLRLTRAQLDGLAQHAIGGQLAPEIASIAPIDLTLPQRIAPGVVAVAAPGHSAGEIVIYVKTTAREFLLIGDIAWVFDNVAHARGRPRFIRWIVPNVDPDRPRVLRQLRALHDLHQSEPDLVILPAHDDAYLRGLIGASILGQGIVSPELAPAPE
jgi:glyoxylase-like metal-dependent hydrolase (beta-lactamase superfamily II)